MKTEYQIRVSDDDGHEVEITHCLGRVQAQQQYAATCNRYGEGHGGTGVFHVEFLQVIEQAEVRAGCPQEIEP